MYFICDDVSVKYLDQLYKLDNLKKKYPDLKVICFVIAKDFNDKLKNWLLQDWIEVGVHGYDHDYPPECEREDKGERIEKSLKILKPVLPKKFGFRAPGFQMTATTYPILRKLGFSYIAHQTKIQGLKCEVKTDLIIKSHIYEPLDLNLEGEFNLIYENCI
jgi:peptidoglycan/xylan/chitin deacetylase (PgdA/CDA1 family)